MTRREFITLLGAAAGWPLVARAQQMDRMQRIGVLMGYAESNVEGQAFVAAFREELLKLGWAEGRNLRERLGDTTVVESCAAAQSRKSHLQARFALGERRRAFDCGNEA